jgi:hypothetical protein
MLKLADNNGYIDVIVYVLIMVGGLVVNAYRNYNKKKEQEKSGVPQPKRKPIFPDVLFEPVFEYEVPVEEKKNVQLPVDESLDSPISSIDTVPDKILAEKTFIEGEAVFESTKELMISDKIFVHEAIEKDDLTMAVFPVQQADDTEDDNEFDVRQAVIYSEILKLKYY